MYSTKLVALELHAHLHKWHCAALQLCKRDRVVLQLKSIALAIQLH